MQQNLLQKLTDYRAERNRREGFDPKQLTDAEADKAMVTLIQHTGEELTELLMCLNRKAWKPLPSIRSEAGTEYRAHAIEELADVLLMLDAWRDTAGVSMEEVAEALELKMAKNLTRLDHACNRETEQQQLNSFFESMLNEILNVNT